MQKPKSASSLLAALLLLVPVFPVAAQASEVARKDANIASGDWNISESLSLTKNSGIRQDSTQFTLSTAVRYYVVDGLALGGSFVLDAESGDDTLVSLGPSLRWDFWRRQQLSAYGVTGVRFGLTDATVAAVLPFIVGLDYFITPSVAFGPALFFSQYIGRHNGDYQRYGFDLAFSIFL